MMNIRGSQCRLSLQCLQQGTLQRSPLQRRWFTPDRIIQEHDSVLLRQRGDKKPKWRLTPRLRDDGEQTIKLTHGAHVRAGDLLGRRYLDRVTDSSGREVTIHEASLASHIVHSERMATPIYPQDCSTIVALMDLNPERAGETETETEDGGGDVFEVFEAGTGMGSLTMHIARAIHAANRPLSKEMRDAIASADIKRRSDTNTATTTTPPPSEEGEPVEEGEGGAVTQQPAETGSIQSLTLDRLEIPSHIASSLQQWQSSRRAVLHTLDRNPHHARGAFKLVRAFRRALYLPGVDFHVGSIRDYLAPRIEASPGGRGCFLSRAVLDLPAPQDVADPVVRALRPNGLLLVFNPSISQIGEFAKWAVTSGQPLKLERVAELANSFHCATDDPGVNDAGGGRPWDVRTVVPKDAESMDGIVQVMRPKVGDRVMGGGFVAVFRRLREKEVVVEESHEEASE